MKKIYRSLGAIALGWFIGSCGDSTGPPPPPPPPTTAIVVMSDGTASVVPVATFQLSATAKDASGQALSRTFAWSSSDPLKATVSQSGTVTGVAAGTAIITAAVDGKSATSNITVLDGGVVPSTGMTLMLDTGKVQVVVPSGALASNTNLWIVPSTAFAGDARVIKETPFDFLPNGTNFAKPVSIRIKYLPANLPAGTEEAALQLHLSGSAGWQIVPGSTVDTSAKVVTAEVSHFSTYAILTPAPVAAVTIRGPPENPPIAHDSLSLIAGDPEQLTATLTDSEGAILSNRAVTWTSSDASIASVTATGLVTALKPGSTVVKATAGGISATVTITVTPVPVSSVTVSLSLQTIFVGQTSQATAVLKDLAGNDLTGRTVTWTSSNTAVATVDANGLVTAVAAGGPVTITGTSETKSGMSSITVTVAPVNLVTVSPASASLVLGVTPTQQLSAELKDVNGNVLTGRTVTWSSSNTAVATVDANGLVTAAGAGGPVTITATSEGKTGSSSITVALAPVAAVTLSSATTPVVLGQIQELTATPKDASGALLLGRTVNWVSSNPAVLAVSAASSVSTAGGATVSVTAVGVGTATITASSESAPGVATPVITVTVIPVNTVTVSPTSVNLVLGITTSQQLTATLRDANNNVLVGRVVTWSSSNPLAATVDANGFVTAVGAGASTITVMSETKTSTSSITVTLAPVNTVTVTPPTASLVMAVTPTQQLTTVLKDVNDNVLTGRTVAWSSNNTAVATVDANGLVTAVAAGGPVTITATSEGKTGTSSITVAVDPVTAVALSAVATPMLVGGTQQLTATPKDVNGVTLSGRTISWVSSNTAVLTVSAATSVSTGSGATVTVTAVGPGSATITATSETKSAATPAVTVNPVPVNTVTVTPPTADLVLGVTPTQQLTAVLKDVNGNVLTGRTVTWTSNNTSLATVDANGLVTAVAAGGPVTITATSETKTGTASVTVSVAPVNTVTVTPPAAGLVLGVTPTQQLTAVLKDVNGAVLTGRTVTWASSNTGIATVDGSGLVTAVGAGGPVTITATSETKTGTSSITVTLAPVNTVTVTPPTAALVLGVTPTQQLAAQLKDVNGNVLTGRTVTWTSDNTAVATVDANGLVTAVGVGGPATITATSETKTGTSSITVTLAPVNTVTVNPTSATLVLVATPTQQLTAELKDVNSNVLTGRAVTWSSSNTAVATVDANGIVTAVAAGGPVTITATSETKTGTASIMVAPAPVATLTLSTLTTPMPVGATQPLTATTRDANNNPLTGRSVSWVSSDPTILTVSPTPGPSGTPVTVTAVGVGTATITATSETKTATTSVITVIPPPVETITLSALTTPAAFGTTQQLTATPKDFAGNTLIGRTVSWVSSNTAVLMVSAASSVSTATGATVMVTAVGVGHATITATSEAKSATTLQITVNPLSGAPATLLSRSIQNPRYFQNESGQPVYLTGSHTWSNMQDNGTVDPPPVFNYSAYLDFLTAHNHNFTILWAWEQSKWTAEIASDYWVSPGPFKRVGPDLALDGKPKFDLTQFDQAYFDRLRSRAQQAGAHGIYVAVMLFDGWSVTDKGDEPLNNPWKGHPFNGANNINGIDGDTDHDGSGLEVQTLGNSAVTALQDAYVRKVIDAVGDLDNVLYEIDNEGDASSKTWQYHMIQVIRDYEATKGKQHPVGMTPMWPNGTDADLAASGADWIAPTGNLEDPSTANGAQVLISDTDHLCGICGTVTWIWKSFTKGQNPILMDGYDGQAVGFGAEGYTSTDPIWETLRKNMGYARGYALQMDLAGAVPHGNLVLSESTGYCLAKPGSQYLVFLPNGGGVTLDLSAVAGSLNYEWFNPATGLVTQTGTVTGGPSVTIAGPSFGGAAVLFVH